MESLAERISDVVRDGEEYQLSSDPEDDRWEQTAAIVRENPEIIRDIKELSKYTYLGLPVDRLQDQTDLDPNGTILPLDILLPHLSMFRPFVHLLSVDCVLSVRNGELDQAIDSLESIRRLQKMIPVSNALIEGMVEIACSGIATELITYRSFDLSDLDEHQLASLESIFVDNPLELSRMSLVENERWVSEATLRSFYKGSKGGRITLKGTQRLLDTYELIYGNANTKPLKDQVAQIKRDIARLHEQLKVQEIFWSMVVNDLSKEPYQIQRFSSEDYLNNPENAEMKFLPSFIVLRSPQVWYSRSLTYETHRKSIALLIAIYKQKLRTGEYPSSISDLDMSLLAIQPTDPYSGKLLKFEVFDDQIFIYSFGPDRDDDGGKPVQNLDGDPDFYPEFRTLNQLKELDPAEIDGDWVLYPLVSN